MDVPIPRVAARSGENKGKQTMIQTVIPGLAEYLKRYQESLINIPPEPDEHIHILGYSNMKTVLFPWTLTVLQPTVLLQFFGDDSDAKFLADCPNSRHKVLIKPAMNTVGSSGSVI